MGSLTRHLNRFLFRPRGKCECYKMPAALLQGGFECAVCRSQHEWDMAHPEPLRDPATYLDGIREEDYIAIEAGPFKGKEGHVTALDFETKEVIVRVINGYKPTDDGTIAIDFESDGTHRIAVSDVQLSGAICDGRTLTRERHRDLFAGIIASAERAGADAEPFVVRDLTGTFIRGKDS
jgi:ribosomal protein L24